MDIEFLRLVSVGEGFLSHLTSEAGDIDLVALAQWRDQVLAYARTLSRDHLVSDTHQADTLMQLVTRLASAYEQYAHQLRQQHVQTHHRHAAAHRYVENS